MPRCKILRHFIYSLMKQYLTLLLIVFTFLLPKAQSPVKELSEQEFKAKVSEYAGGFEKWQFKGERPAVIDFYATWCGPCRMIAPSLENLAKKYEGKVDFYKVNVDNCRNLAIAYSVESIPMVIFAPIDQFGCLSASLTVTFLSSSRVLPKNGPPDAVSISFF